MAKKTSPGSDRGPRDVGNVEGLLGGLGQLIEKLGDLAEKGRELRESGEFQSAGKTMQGVYGFTVKTGLGGSDEGKVKVEPFGNIRADAKTGKAVVHEVLEPMVDVFEEPEHVLVVAEMPGVGDEDIRLELRDDVLSIDAARASKQYHKEVLLPASFDTDRMSRSCHNGILEVTLRR
ncbi:MAG: Hsp20/alpha crystallin family protein [Isosphaeraceae bacterium]|nr:Hsp20/alpha crystallin family protein [Isosphaeraceae bacterium]